MLKESSGLCDHNGPFIFISYAREDSGKVEKFLQGLEERNYRFWYDAGLKPGHQWTRDLAEKIENCECFFAMISEDYIRSAYCETELGLAMKQKRFVVPIYLEDTELPGSFYLQIGKMQYIRLDEEKNGIWRKLDMTEEIQKCRDISPSRDSEGSPSPTGKRHQPGLKRPALFAALILLLIAAGILAYLLWVKPASVPDSSREESPAVPVQTPAYTEIPSSTVTEEQETKFSVLIDHLTIYDSSAKWEWINDLKFVTVYSEEYTVPWTPNFFVLKLNYADPESIPFIIEIYGKLNEADEYKCIRSISSEKLNTDKFDFALNEEEQELSYRFFKLKIFQNKISDPVEIDWAELQQR